MRVLLVAYSYPPLAAPQAIRWHYLSRELARMGIEVHVLAPDVAARYENAITVPEGVVVHRCDSGGLVGWSLRLQRLRRRRSAIPSREFRRAFDIVQPNLQVGLNWRGRLLRFLDRCVGLFRYPDSRAQWFRPATSTLDRLLKELSPDLLISSHEPPIGLQLGLGVVDRVPAWLIDLGDPVLTNYTPFWWRRRARILEAAACRQADAVVVTTTATRDLLATRHALPENKFHVIGQGFDDVARPSAPLRPPHDDLRLLYTGRIYTFRDPKPLLEAVLALAKISLTMVVPEVPPSLLKYTRRSGGRIIFVGELPHAEVTKLQREYDVLVNIGNAMPEQTPGKLFEYLGSGQPILHCYYSTKDPAIALIDTWRRGWSCPNDIASLCAQLTKLLKVPAMVAAAALGDSDAIARHGWSSLAQELKDICSQIVDAQMPCQESFNLPQSEPGS